MKLLLDSVNLLFIAILTDQALSLPNSYPHPIDTSPPINTTPTDSDEHPLSAPIYTPPVYTGFPSTDPPPLPPYYPTTTNPPAPPPASSYPPASYPVTTLTPPPTQSPTSSDCPDPTDNDSIPSSTSTPPPPPPPSSTLTASNAILILPPSTLTPTPTPLPPSPCQKCCPHTSSKDDWLMAIGHRIAADLCPLLQGIVDREETKCGLIAGKGARVVGCEVFPGGVVCGWKWEKEDGKEGGVAGKWTETVNARGWDEVSKQGEKEVLLG